MSVKCCGVSDMECLLTATPPRMSILVYRIRRVLARCLNATFAYWFGLLSVGVTVSCLLTGRPLPSLVVFTIALVVTHRNTTAVLRRRTPVDWLRLFDSCAVPIRDFINAVGRTASLATATSCDLKDVGNGPDAPMVASVNNNVMSELDFLLEYITRDFVLNWYQQFSTNEQFSSEIHYALEDLTVALVSRVRKLRSGGLHPLVCRLVRTFHRYFVGYLRALARAKDAARQQPNGASGLDVQQFFDDWHYAMSSTSVSSPMTTTTTTSTQMATELRHLHNLVDLTLEVLMPADVLCSPLTRRLVLSLIAESVLLPTVDLFSSPDWINKQLVLLLGGTDELVEVEAAAATVCYTSVPERDASNEECVGAKLSTKATELSALGKDSNEAGSSFKADDLESVRDWTANCDTEMDSNPCPAGGCADGIWRRIADKNPATFRTERQQEISEILQEKKKTLKLPVSTSFDKLSDIFSNTIGELERPLEFITGNLAHYFRMTLDDAADGNGNGNGNGGGGRVSAASSSPSISHQSSGQSPSSLDLDEEGDDVDRHKVSSVLGRFLPVTTGPVLADHLWGLGHRGLRMREAMGNCISSVVRDRRPSVASSNTSSTSSDKEPEDASMMPLLPEQQQQLLLSDSVAESQQPKVSPLPVESLAGSTVAAPSKLEDNNEMTLCETPTFANLLIPRSEIVEERSSGVQYVVYRIQYDAWYRNAPSEIAEKDPEVDEKRDADEPLQEDVVLLTRVVRRRFREFETLHSCLEDDPQLRPHLRGIKGPNKWSVLPFSKLDSEAIGERRMALELYLQMLISKKPIANSCQLKEFLAYGSDASIAYVRKSTSDLPRLDKFLMKTVSGMFDKLKTALPSLPAELALPDLNNDVDVATAALSMDAPTQQQQQQQKTSERLLGFLNFNSPVINTNEDDSPQLRLSFDFSTETPNCSRNVEEMVSCFLVGHDEIYDKVDTAADAAIWQQDFWNLRSGLTEESLASRRSSDLSSPMAAADVLATKMQSDAASGDDDDDDGDSVDRIDEAIPLASAVIDLSVETIVDNDGALIDREPFVTIAKIVFGQLLERYLEELVDYSTTEAMFTHYVRFIRESIWPNGVYATQPEDRLTDAQKEKLYRLTLKTLRNYFPGAIVAVFGRAQYRRGMKLFLDSLQHPKLLRHLVYQFLDILVDVLLVRSRSQSIMEKLSSCYSLS